MMATVLLKNKNQLSVYQIKTGHEYCLDAQVNCDATFKDIKFVGLFFLTMFLFSVFLYLFMLMDIKRGLDGNDKTH